MAPMALPLLAAAVMVLESSGKVMSILACAPFSKDGDVQLPFARGAGARRNESQCRRTTQTIQRCFNPQRIADAGKRKFGDEDNFMRGREQPFLCRQ